MATETQTCKVQGCKRPYRSKGYCGTHFKRWRRNEMPKKGRYKTCSEEGCRKPMVKRGLCETHLRALVSSQQKAPAASATAAPPAPDTGPASEKPAS